MPHGLPSIGRQSYDVRIKLRRDTHMSWVELKALPKLKCDDALACYLLTSIETVSSSIQDSQVKESSYIWKTHESRIECPWHE